MTSLKKWIVIFLTAVFMAGVVGCSEDGPMEKLGKKTDKAVEDAKKAVKKIGD